MAMDRRIIWRILIYAFILLGVLFLLYIPMC